MQKAPLLALFPSGAEVSVGAVMFIVFTGREPGRRGRSLSVSELRERDPLCTY